ncbi:MAG: dockerin type I repeat-containing protein [Clostridia bacterium]|nr:dockerin type I repeat-containing protein [Clostridia bacterium]
MSVIKRIVSILAAMSVTAAAVSFGSVSANAADAVRYLKGDVNGDFDITLRDATRAQKIQLNLSSPSSLEKDAADMNGNGTVELADAYLIQKYVTRNPQVLNGDSSAGISAYAPYKQERIAFYEALNEDRASKGLKAVSYNDLFLNIGQQACNEWATEFAGGSKSYSGYISEGGNRRKVALLFSEYGVPDYNSNGNFGATTNGYLDGDKEYQSLKAAQEGDEKSPYNTLLMRENPTAICVGIHKLNDDASDDSALWAFVGY